MPLPGIVGTLSQRQQSAGVSTLGTSDIYHCIAAVNSRKCFFAEDRFWAFYSDGTNFVYQTSLDGFHWTDPVSLGNCSNGYHGSVWFDGTYLHYSRYDSYILYYRRGKPKSDGTVAWSADEQTVYSGSATDVYYAPMIAVDSLGYAWIGAIYYDGTDYLIVVFKNANKDGTWSTDSGFPYTLNATSDSGWWVTIVPLTLGKVYVIYARGGPSPNTFRLPLGKLYNGSTWGSEESDLADYTVYGGFAMSAEAQGDDVHFSYLTNTTTRQIRYNRRVYGTGWQTSDEKVITVYPTEANSLYAVPALSVDKTRNTVYVFWIYWLQSAGGGIRYRRRLAGKWDDSSTKMLIETEATDNELAITCFNRDYGGKIGVLYPTNLTPPMNVRFTWINLQGTVFLGKALFGKRLSVKVRG